MSALHDSGGRKEEFGHKCGGVRGPSSFHMHNPDVVFGEIGLKSGENFMDLGCGSGDYAIYAARIVGDKGTVYAIDKWETIVTNLIGIADSLGLENIIGAISDITNPLPVNDSCIDVCFVSTVLHTLNMNKSMPLLKEIRRVLKPDGRLSIIECKKQGQSFGPPQNVRLSPEEIEELVMLYGFKKIGCTDLGYNYLIQFKLSVCQEKGIAL